MRHLRSMAALPLLLVAGLLACDGTPTSLSAPAAPALTIATQATLDAEIRALVNAGFPKGQATSILAKWDQVLKSLAKDLRTTLKGKVVPGSGGRTELTRTLDYVQQKISTVTPPAGETKEHFVARLALDMSLYVYGGAATPVPAFTPTADIAFEIVQPATTDTVVTPASEAAVIFPAGAVSEPTVVVITPITTYYPDNCSGPLDTKLCQYPRFYHFNVFPDVKLAVPAKVQVCHVDAGSERLPLADHDRFRIAHEKPASPADYSAGSTIVNNVEVLALTPMNVTTCTLSGGTTYGPTALRLPEGGRFTGMALALARAAGSALKRIVSPRDAYAIDIGGGGYAEEFSIFGVVDPQSKQDLAQSTTTYFAPTMTSLVVGQQVPVQAWNVRNLGSGTSGAFTSQVVVASDSLLTSPILTYSLGGAGSLVPQANFSYPAQSFTMPGAAGTYFVGTRVVYLSTDSTAADDWKSMRVVVAAPIAYGYSLDTGATYGTGGSGGSGGSPYTISCPSGSVATGLSGETGSYYGWASIFHARLQCAPLLANGSLGTPVTTSQAGAFSGGSAFAGTCSGGGLLVGGAGHTTGGAPMVADLSGSCASLATIAALGAPTSTLGPWIGSGVNYSNPFALQCNPGSVVTGLQGSAGDILDAIGFRCTPLNVSTP